MHSRNQKTTIARSSSNGSLCSSANGSICSASLSIVSAPPAIISSPGFFVGAIGKASRENGVVPSRRAKRNASKIAAVATFLIFAWAIRSCIPPQVTTWHKQRVQPVQPVQQTTRSTRSTRSNYTLRSTSDTALVNPLVNPLVNHSDPTAAASSASSMSSVSSVSNHTRNDIAILNNERRRLKQMEYGHKAAPNDLKNLVRNKVTYNDPKSATPRHAMPLDEYKLNPLVKPTGYPWHRWAKKDDGTYPLNTTKFVDILSRLGSGEDTLGTMHPSNYTLKQLPLTPDVVRLGPKVRPYIIRNGTVLRPGSRTGMFVTLVQRAVEMSSLLADGNPRMTLLAEGDFPVVFDANDYPWCGDDLVPVFRLNAIKSAAECRHSWPAMSLTYFQDPTNVQLAESPYQWDEMMAGYDAAYPWERKIPKLVWRGRITGYTHRRGERPRQALVRYAQNYLDIMDVKPSTQKSKIPQDDFQKYKAILDIDGNAWSARLGKLLCYNSVVIKVEPTYVGYWEKEIEPWVHYIPAEPDFSDLEKTVRYVIDPKNSEQMKQIVKNGQQFCRTKLTMEQYTVDILWSLLAYAEMLAGSPDFYDVWKRDRSAYGMQELKMGAWTPQGPLAGLLNQ